MYSKRKVITLKKFNLSRSLLLTEFDEKAKINQSYRRKNKFRFADNE